MPAGVPFDANLGVPGRIDCGVAPPQQMVIPRQAPVEIVFPDDTLNQILRAARWGGLLEFPVDASLLVEMCRRYGTGSASTTGSAA